jgi:hypothetical protein
VLLWVENDLPASMATLVVFNMVPWCTYQLPTVASWLDSSLMLPTLKLQLHNITLHKSGVRTFPKQLGTNPSIADYILDSNKDELLDPCS